MLEILNSVNDSQTTNFSQGWGIYKLGDLALVGSGTTPNRSVPGYWQDGSIPWVKTGEIDYTTIEDTEEKVTPRALSETSLTVYPVGTVLVAMYGQGLTRGKAGILGIEATTNQACAAITPKDERLVSRYLFHYLSYHYQNIRSISHGSNQSNLSEGLLASFCIYLPTNDEQLRITEILDTIDSTITQTSTLIAKLKQMKAGLLHDLLTRGLDENGELRNAIDRPEQFKDSPLGQIPKNWEVVPAHSLCSLITKGTTPPATSFSSDPSQIRYIRVDNLTFTGELNLDLSPLYVDRKTHKTFLARSCIFGGDVLMNIVGPPLGKIALVPVNSGEWNLNQAIAIFRVVRDISPEFLLYWLQSRTAQTWFLQRAKQTSGQVNLTLELCQTLPVPIPPPEEQTKIISAIYGVNQRISTEEEDLKKLNKLKKGLMSDLLTGRVRVTDLKEIPA